MSKFKVVMFGPVGVGKTSLVNALRDGPFDPYSTTTIGAAFSSLQVDGRTVEIWDTAGQERFRSITQSYYRSAHAIVLVCV